MEGSFFWQKKERGQNENLLPKNIPPINKEATKNNYP